MSETNEIGQRLMDAIIDGRMVFHREDIAIVFIWQPGTASQLTAIVDAELDYACPCGCGVRLVKHHHAGKEIEQVSSK